MGVIYLLVLVIWFVVVVRVTLCFRKPLLVPRSPVEELNEKQLLKDDLQTFMLTHIFVSCV